MSATPAFPTPAGDRAAQARCVLRSHLQGVLSTLSRRCDGAPFGSVTPFVVDAACRPVILVSSLAEHTRNLQADARCSLLAHPCVPDSQAAARVTVVGRARRLPDKQALAPRYLRYFPQAQAQYRMEDFQFYVIEPQTIRYIGGFGSIHWISAEDFAPPANSLQDTEQAIVDTLNRDQLQRLRGWCAQLHGVQPRELCMVGVDVDGCDLRADEQLLRLDFARPAPHPQALHEALAELDRACAQRRR